MDTESEALQKAADLLDQGYECLPFDEPHRAMRGVVCFKKTSQDEAEYEEDCHELIWPIFGSSYETDKEMVSPGELLRFAKDHKTELCDNPKALRMGLVYYDHDRKVAVVREMKVADLRRASKETKDEMLEFRQLRFSEHMRGEEALEVHKKLRDKTGKMRKHDS